MAMLYLVCGYLSKLGLKLIHFREMALGVNVCISFQQYDVSSPDVRRHGPCDFHGELVSFVSSGWYYITVTSHERHVS